MKVVILAGGYGTRLTEETGVKPKPMVEIARLVADTFPGCELTIGQSDQDDRSYRVSFDKIQRFPPQA